MTRLFTAYGQPLALDPKAFGMVLVEQKTEREARMLDGAIGVVDVHGPLMHHPDPCADSYDDVKRRVQNAIDQGARCVVLSIDSPGGLVSGAFDTSDEIRAICDTASVELVAFVDGMATSAAYALACVASKIYTTSTGIVGSIGVIDALIDATAQDRAIGLQFSIIASGARKADGNPHTTTTDAAIATAQARVDDLAAIFFAHVERRRGIPVARIEALQAGFVHGAHAHAAGLVDGIATFDQVLALLRGGDVTNAAASATTSNGGTMTEAEIRAALQAVIDDESSDDKAKARAKAALAAMGECEDETLVDDGAKSEGDESTEDEPKKDEEPSAIAALAARVMVLEASSATVGKALEVEQRKALRASRPDVSVGVHDALGALSLSAYRDALSKIEKPKTVRPAATAQVAATRGAASGASAKTIAPNELLDARMGFARAANEPIHTDPTNPTRRIFGVLSREQARAITAKYTDGGAR